MSPFIKKAVAALAIKEGIEKVQEWRQPAKPSIWARLGKMALITGAGAGAYYAYKNGMLTGILDQIKGKSRTDEYSYSASRDVNLPSTGGFESPEGSPVG